jgi:WD40 repeat protein
MVRIWDLTSRSPVGDPLIGHTNAVTAVACTQLDDRAIAVTGSCDHTVRIWDLVTGTNTALLAGHTGPVIAVACTDLEGRPIAVTSGEDLTVQVWDVAAAPSSARALPTPLR